MSSEPFETDLFGEKRSQQGKALQDPVTVDVVVLRDSTFGVQIRDPESASEHWVSKQHIVWDGRRGAQPVRIEKWKAKECGLA